MLVHPLKLLTREIQTLFARTFLTFPSVSHHDLKNVRHGAKRNLAKKINSNRNISPA